jgi:hypothetical protein
MKKGLVLLLAAFTAMLVLYGLADAKVKGLCVDCHTMHNSEDNAPMAVENDTGWNASLELAGVPRAEPIPHLLKASCIACHTNSGSDTIVTVGANRIPIVRNLTVEPVNMLAGGNFYWVDPAGPGGGNDNMGHNIMSEDTFNGGRSVLAPGGNQGASCTESCHYTLYDPLNLSTAISGCQGCHFSTYHHKDQGTAAGQDPTYRYLQGPASAGHNGYFVGWFTGAEEANWEQTGTTHNTYIAYDVTPGVINSANTSVSAFCAACHGIFHEQQTIVVAGDTLWIRHPADQALPTGAGYEYPDFTAGANYTKESPVAYTGSSGQTGPRVMCLSCHRPHGSPYSNLLRWNYADAGSSMIAGGGGTGGCFNCHTEKDNP